MKFKEETYKAVIQVYEKSWPSNFTMCDVTVRTSPKYDQYCLIYEIIYLKNSYTDFIALQKLELEKDEYSMMLHSLTKVEEPIRRVKKI